MAAILVDQINQPLPSWSSMTKPKSPRSATGARRPTCAVQTLLAGTGVCTDNLNTGVVVMKSAQDGARTDHTASLNRARNRRILVQGSMRSGAIVQRGLRTPTGPFFARCFIGIILGLVVEFAFMGPSTRLVISFFAARWMGRKQIVGLKSQRGCSTGRHALTSLLPLSPLSASTHLRRSQRCSIWR
jgi:hypothetical protein